MATILLVPGTQATELVEADGKVAYSASGLEILSKLGPVRAARIGQHTLAEWTGLLSLVYDDGALDPRPESVRLWPGLPLRTPYEPFQRDFGSRLNTVAYDWRLDVFANGRDLLDRIATPSDAADGRWRLVGHSQGGLIIVAAGALAGRDEFARRVSHVALVGSPLAGTMRAAEALLWGRDDFGGDDATVTMLRDAARTWPALHQMMPGWTAVSESDGTPCPAELQLSDPRGWSRAFPLDPALVPHLARTQVFHEQALAWLRDPGDIRLKVIMGLDQETPNGLRRTPDLPDGLDGQPTEPGDTLVPAMTTIGWAGGALNQPTELVQPNLKHAMLLKDAEVRASLRGFLA